MTVLLYTLGVVLFLLGLAVSIGLHEVGHMVPAKRFGAKVTQYFVGFGPTVWSRQRGETEYGVKWLPLGGYVKIVGMFPPAPGPEGETDETRVRSSNTGLFTQLISDARAAEWEHVKPGDEGRLFYKLPWWKKVIVMAGGPTVNLVLAFLMFAGVFAIHGVAEPTTQVATVSDCVIAVRVGEEPRQCAADDPASPAAKAGLQPGDTIEEFNGTAVTSYRQLQNLIRDNGANKATIVVDRDGESVTLTTVTAVNTVYADLDGGSDDTTQAGFLGITPESAMVHHGPIYTLQEMGTMTARSAEVILKFPVKVWEVGKAALGMQERDPESPMSVVGASRVAGEISSAEDLDVAAKTATLFMLLGALNLFLGLFNFVPLLPLDGGHIAGALYEGARKAVARVRGRPDPGHVDVAKLLPVAYVVAIAFLLMSVVLIYADFVAPV